jgi:hypothetical protein
MTMQLCKRTTLVALSLALAAVVATDAASSPNIDRRLELADICRYSPDTKVTDENAFDLVRPLKLTHTVAPACILPHIFGP